MKISFLCSDEHHPVNDYLYKWIEKNASTHQIELVRSKAGLTGGDLLFLISCSQIVTAKDRERYTYSLVLHASDLPKGRGWSPHIWEIIKGATEITLTLLEAEDKVDSGRIWCKKRIPIAKDLLWDEINARLFSAELELIDFAVNSFSHIRPAEQSAQITPSYYSKRSPEDSQIDPGKTLTEQFDQIRVCDPERFPAYFELHGKKYKIILEKVDG